MIRKAVKQKLIRGVFADASDYNRVLSKAGRYFFDKAASSECIGPVLRVAQLRVNRNLCNRCDERFFLYLINIFFFASLPLLLLQSRPLFSSYIKSSLSAVKVGFSCSHQMI